VDVLLTVQHPASPQAEERKCRTSKACSSLRNECSEKQLASLQLAEQVQYFTSSTEEHKADADAAQKRMAFIAQRVNSLKSKGHLQRSNLSKAVARERRELRLQIDSKKDQIREVICQSKAKISQIQKDGGKTAGNLSSQLDAAERDLKAERSKERNLVKQAADAESANFLTNQAKDAEMRALSAEIDKLQRQMQEKKEEYETKLLTVTAKGKGDETGEQSALKLKLQKKKTEVQQLKRSVAEVEDEMLALEPQATVKKKTKAKVISNRGGGSFLFF